MKVSDYVIDFLINKGAETVFGYQGSSISHVIDSISRREEIQFIQTRHEQAAAFAANGYSCTQKEFGVAIACSGPGATNLITGIANAYYDSNACFFITGQVSIPEIRKNKKQRQLGFQETDIVEMVDSITKYAVTVLEPYEIAYHLEKAFFYMMEGRKGAVLIDIPHNIQTSDVDILKLRHFEEEKDYKHIVDESKINESIEMLKLAKKPLILVGGGAKPLCEDDKFENFCEKNKIPVVSSYQGKDVVNNESSCYMGVVGAYGNRIANYAVFYSDLLIVLGSRLDGRQTGGDFTKFAPNAKVILVDIDEIEMEEKPETYHKIYVDLLEYVKALMQSYSVDEKNSKWFTALQRWRENFSQVDEYKIQEYVNPNKIIRDVTDRCSGRYIVTTDVGQNQIWTNTSANIKRRGRLIQSCGLGAMGYALPAAIGAYYGGGEQVICFSGDGGFQMNMQELQTIQCHKIPIKIFVLNNHSLGLIRIYQEKALNSNFEGSVVGFGSPNYEQISQSYGINYFRLFNNNYEAEINEILKSKEPCLVEIIVSDNSTAYPEPTYRGTIENQSPLLDMDKRNKLERDMNHE